MMMFTGLNGLLMLSLVCFSAKRTPGKSKQQVQQEKRQDIEKRLQDVTGQLGGGASAKKSSKKGMYNFHLCFNNHLLWNHLS